MRVSSLLLLAGLLPTRAQDLGVCNLCGEGESLASSNFTTIVPTSFENGTIFLQSTTCDEIIDLQATLNETECESLAPFARSNCGCQTTRTEDAVVVATEEATAAPTISPTNVLGEDDDETEEGDDCVATKDSETLRNTCRLYGSIFLVSLLLFCILRRQYPKTFAVRNFWGDDQTQLANPDYGFFEWISKVVGVSDEDFQDACGMDGLCLARINYFGFKMCVVCMLNAVWLLPIYGTAQESDETECITDRMQSITISNVPSGDSRLIAVTIAAYIIFGFAMYSILGELEWLKTYRHRFMTKVKARNYTVYLRSIPENYLSHAKLKEYFGGVYDSDEVCVDIHLARKIPNLSKLVLTRETTKASLDHAHNVQTIKGETPTHKTKMFGGEVVDSIETYSKEIDELNTKIKDVYGKIETSQQKDKAGSMMEEPAATSPDDGDSEDEDGEKLTAAFISFKSLRATAVAIKMDHSDQPYDMRASEAPDPDDVQWANVGKTQNEISFGNTLSLGLMVFLSFFWTAIIAFAASLSSVEGLRDSFDFVDKALNKSPWLEPVLAQLAPFIVVVVNSSLKVVLTLFASLELPLSGAQLEVSLFSKLSFIMILHNFFVASIGGASAAALSDFVIAADIQAVIDLLATSLPAQSTFHIQILLVNVFLTMSLELLGVARIAVAYIRKLLGPGLTEEESMKDWMGLKPLNDPDVFQHAFTTSWNALYFMVLFVYSTIAPMSSFFMGLSFLILLVGYRYVLIYIYPVRPDSGGMLYVWLLRVLLVSMVIAEFTILGLLGIKQSAIASTLMIPLVIVTVMFNMYVKQRHFAIIQYLPAGTALMADKEREQPQEKQPEEENGGNDETSFDTKFLVGAYVHPDMKLAAAETETKPTSQQGSDEVEELVEEDTP